MPKAVVDFSDTERHDLKTLPGGFVVLRRLSFGQKLQRQQMAVQMNMRGQGKNAEASLVQETTKVSAFEFAHCVVEHNLEDLDGRTLNFQNVADVVKLHPMVGEEVDALINGMNNYEESDEIENLPEGSEQASS